MTQTFDMECRCCARHELPDGRILYDSYHCSRYNTQTRRLTEAMFHAVFEFIQQETRR